jgi:hypothetical protein
MFKRALMAALLALSFLSVFGIQGSIPPPECGTGSNPPCPWVN